MKTRWSLFLFVILFITSSLSAQTDQDKKEVMQLCLDLPALQPYLHSEKPERIPLVVVKNGKSPEVSISKFGKNVIYLTDDEIDSKGITAAVEFIRFELNTENGTIMYRYSAEGLMITTLVKKVNGSWTVSDSKVVER